MAQVRGINLVKNMLTFAPPRVPDHEREVLIVRALWVLTTLGWVYGGVVLPSALMLAGAAGWIVGGIYLCRFERPYTPYRVGEVR